MQRIVLPPGVILATTSGSHALADLQHLVEVYSDVPVRTGVLYPLQTFTKDVSLDYSQIPFCIEATEEDSREALFKLAESVSPHVQLADTQERRALHIAAVFACNFANQLFSIAHDLLKEERLSFDLLKPLIRETTHKALLGDDPAKVQTGPARRSDWATTSRHLDYLQERNPEWTALYRLLTESIRERHFEEE